MKVSLTAQSLKESIQFIVKCQGNCENSDGVRIRDKNFKWLMLLYNFRFSCSADIEDPCSGARVFCEAHDRQRPQTQSYSYPG